MTYSVPNFAAKNAAVSRIGCSSALPARQIRANAPEEIYQSFHARLLRDFASCDVFREIFARLG